MGGDVETIKERLDIAEVVSGYIKLEKAGKSLKARCPFHSEKTPSFYVSPLRQSYYCFGCGAKGDIFTFVQEMEGVSFREALKSLADKAGVELKSWAPENRGEKETLRQILTVAAEFFEKKLAENKEVREYLASRGITPESIKRWRLGLAPDEWRSLGSHLSSLGFDKKLMLKAGLIKEGGYDVFRNRIMFPIADANGEIIAFSGRGEEPKYLNTPETALFRKNEVLYGLDVAKGEIRKKNFAVLVEGQIDLVLSHQVGVGNTVASSGTAFTQAHLERLKRLSPRIILAFDGDKAGFAASKKAAELALALGLEVKVAKLPAGDDPADIIKKNPEAWREILRKSLPAIEYFLGWILETESDQRKRGIKIRQDLLPMLARLQSSIECSHFVSLITKKTGIKEEMIWEDLKRVKTGSVEARLPQRENHRESVEERLTEVRAWLKENPSREFKKEEEELVNRLKHDELKEELSRLRGTLSLAESSKDEEEAGRATKKIQEVLKGIRELEDVV